jgi:hypothetical protein
VTILCGTEWGAEWGSYYGPCDPTDLVDFAQSAARARLMEGEVFAALVQLIGETYETIEQDAWLLSLRMNITVAGGQLLDDLGDNYGLPRLGTWNDAYYRKVLAAWIPLEFGGESIPKLMALLEALSDGAVAYSVEEYLPCHVWIHLDGIAGPDASLWVQVLEAARPRGIQFWVSYAVVNPGAFTLDESELDGLDVLAGMFEM